MGMDDKEVVRLIKYAEAMGLDPAIVLKMRLSFDSSGLRSNRRFERPKGQLSLTDAMEKYGLSTLNLALLRSLGMPTRKLRQMTLVKEDVLGEWIKKLPKRRSRYD
jgi:hypothetical protein